MRRRDFLAALGSAAGIAPRYAWAQQAPAVIGLLGVGDNSPKPFLDGLREGLRENGFEEGRNLTIEYRWAEGNRNLLPKLAADLAARNVAVIVTTGGPSSALAAKGATSTIPIVFGSGGDPVQLGLVPSLNRPGGNLTGVNPMISMLEPKRLALLHELVPSATVISALFNPQSPTVEEQRADVLAAAQSLGLQVVTENASNPAEIEAALARIADTKAGALLVTGDPMFNTSRKSLASLAVRYRLPGIYEFRDYVTAGGLMSYGADLPEVYRQMGAYAARILKGEKPADLPVQQATRFELVINLQTANAIGLTIPPTLLARADEVIE